MGGAHRGWYDKPIMHDGIRRLHERIAPSGLSAPEVSTRWLAHHSALGEADGIVLGASTLSQPEGNLGDIKKGPLSDEVVKAVEEMWEAVKGEAPP